MDSQKNGLARTDSVLTYSHRICSAVLGVGPKGPWPQAFHQYRASHRTMFCFVFSDGGIQDGHPGTVYNVTCNFKLAFCTLNDVLLNVVVIAFSIGPISTGSAETLLR